MSRLNSPADFQREISEVDHLIRIKEEFAATYGTDFATTLSLHSLRARRESLSEEMASLEMPSQQEIVVIFEGRPVHDHSVEAGFLALMLRDLQKVVQAIVASAAGTTGRTGRHADEVRRRSSLRFAGAFAGSFGMRLETAEQEFPFEDAGSVPHTLDTLVRLLDSEEGSQELLDHLAPLSARARAEYVRLLEHLSTSGAAMRLDWPTPQGLRSARIGARRAGRVVSRLKQVEERETLRSYLGVLDGAMKTRGYFEFRADDGTVFSGDVTANVIPRLREYFDRACIALISTREITDLSTGDRRVHHWLEDLQPPDSGLLTG